MVFTAEVEFVVKFGEMGNAGSVGVDCLRLKLSFGLRYFADLVI